MLSTLFLLTFGGETQVCYLSCLFVLPANFLAVYRALDRLDRPVCGGSVWEEGGADEAVHVGWCLEEGGGKGKEEEEEEE